jgi:hypothetical protein
MGTPPSPIMATPWPEDASTPQTMMTVMLQTIVPQPDTELPLERQQAHQEGQQARARSW